MKWLKNQKGDTVVEVLLSVAVLSLILSISYGLANRSTMAVRASQERSEALKINEAQQESLKTYLSDPNHEVPAEDVPFCLSAGAIQTPPACSEGTDSRYSTQIILDNGVYTATTTWDRISGGQDRLQIAYKVYLASDTETDLTEEPDGETQSCLPNQWLNTAGVCAYICSNSDDDDGDGRIDLLDPGCLGNAQRTTETGSPVAPQISGSTTDFGTWHLYNTGGTRTTRVFTVTNPSNDVAVSITPTLTAGAGSGFTISSNGCSGMVPRGGSCNITIQFYPPSGAANNRLGNAGQKTATLRVSNNYSQTSSTLNLSGGAFSDRAGPGDIITDTTQGYLRTYSNAACYNNVFACGSPFTGIAGNGNLILGNTYCAWGGWGPGGYGNYPFGANQNRLVMQTDGNLVFYDPYTYRYASWTHGVPGLWMQIQDLGGGVYLSSGSGGPVYKWIHYGGSCFAW